MIDATTRTALLVEAHRAISDRASALIAIVGSPTARVEVHYPPNQTLTHAEEQAIRNLRLSDEARLALVKLVRDAASSAFFQFFCFMDGVADPPQFLNGQKVYDVWLGAALAPQRDGFEPMLHDEFYEAYWAFRDQTRQGD